MMFKRLFVFFLMLMIWTSLSQAYFVTFKDNKMDPGSGKNKLSLYVTNDSDKMLPIEIRPMTREQDELGNEINNDTDDLFIVPFQLLLPPFSEQSVSVQWVGDSLVTKEKAYRLIVDPIPVKENEGQEVKSIYTVVVFKKSLYVLPKEKVVSLELIEAKRVYNEELKEDLLFFKFKNNGTIHYFLQSMEFEYPIMGDQYGQLTVSIADLSLVNKPVLEKLNVLPDQFYSGYLPWPEEIDKTVDRFELLDIEYEVR